MTTLGIGGWDFDTERLGAIEPWFDGLDDGERFAIVKKFHETWAIWIDKGVNQDSLDVLYKLHLEIIKQAHRHGVFHVENVEGYDEWGCA